MTINIGAAKDPKARYRICDQAKGCGSVFATCDTLDEVAEWLAANCTWTMVAQGVEALYSAGVRVSVLDRMQTYRERGESYKFGPAPESHGLTQRTSGYNPREDD